MRSIQAREQASWQSRLDGQRTDLKAFWMAAFSGVVIGVFVNLFASLLYTLTTTTSPPGCLWLWLALCGVMIAAGIVTLLVWVRPGWLREDIELQLAIPIAVEPGSAPAIPALHGGANLTETLYHLVQWSAENRDEGPVSARVAATFDDPSELTGPALSWAMPWLLQALVYHEVAALSHKTLGSHGEYSRWFPVKAAHGGEVSEVSREELAKASDNSLLVCPSLKQSAMLPVRLRFDLPPLGGAMGEGERRVLLKMQLPNKAEVTVSTRPEVSFWREGKNTYEDVKRSLKTVHPPQTALKVLQHSLDIRFRYKPSWAILGGGDKEAARFRWWTEVCRTLADDLDIECIQQRADRNRS